VEGKRWWKTVVAEGATDLSLLSENRPLCEALLQLLALADEASIGFGIPGSSLTGSASLARDRAYWHARELLLHPRGDFGANLAENIESTKLRVLPKLHTPQTGLTIRSMSHNLALCPANEIKPHWSVVPRLGRKTELNLLLAPWPLEIRRSQFRSVSGSKAGLANLPPQYGFFTFEIAEDDARFRAWFNGILNEARDKMGMIDGIVLPELSITGQQWLYARKRAARASAFLVSGVGKAAAKVGTPGQNCVNVDIPLDRDFIVHLPTQEKHHRWQLEEFQIGRYGLDRILAPDRLWWEYSKIEKRTLNFIPLYDWLTMTVLICEDLARPDPVGEIVRAVGPNLVISLLMDAGQRTDRWSSRYAAALADDPGCSVLTLTSLGMTQLTGTSTPKSRSIALWKDAKSGAAQVIDLAPRASAIVLKIGVEEREEWSADGRSDEGTTCYPVLRKVVQIPWTRTRRGGSTSTGVPSRKRLK
jgi:hypothetical protein